MEPAYIRTRRTEPSRPWEPEPDSPSPDYAPPEVPDSPPLDCSPPGTRLAATEPSPSEPDSSESLDRQNLAANLAAAIAILQLFQHASQFRQLSVRDRDAKVFLHRARPLIPHATGHKRILITHYGRHPWQEKLVDLMSPARFIMQAPFYHLVGALK